MSTARSNDWLARGCLASLAIGCISTLTATSTMSAAPRLLADVLVMDGTTFSTPAPGFVDSAIKDFVGPTLGGSYTGIPVTTPEQIVGINQSVYTGLSALQQAMAQQEQRAPGQPYVIFGYSQSAVIVDLEKIALAKQKAAGQPVPDVTFVVIGNGERPNGGIAERFSGLTIPFFDFTFNGAQPTNTGIPTIDIARQYDGLADTPEYPINLLADANALLGVIFAHALYGEQVSLDPTSPKYVAGTTEQQHGDTTYYFIPAETLPLLEPLHLLGIPQSVLNIVQPVLRVLVEAGYDRATPFWVPEPAQLIPSTDPVTLAIELTGAVLQGTQNAVSLVGLKLPGYSQLSGVLAKAQTQVAAAIAGPYRQLVSALNTINPIVAFDHIEGAVANFVDRVINATGIPHLLNKILDATVLRLTAWAERTLLFPQHTPAATTAAASTTPATHTAATQARRTAHRSKDTARQRITTSVMHSHQHATPASHSATTGSIGTQSAPTDGGSNHSDDTKPTAPKQHSPPSHSKPTNHNGRKSHHSHDRTSAAR